MEKSNPNPIHNEAQINRKLTSRGVTMKELETYLRLKFQDYKEAGKVANISEGRVRQILIRYKLPKTSKLINQIARGWDIDPVKLALLFERQEEENENN